ncbi:MAG: hypothetical protein FJZ95_03260, partial [Chloroflexi bacterium]|nr:hypothetical protein [Chloroflexota bacterium]
MPIRTLFFIALAISIILFPSPASAQPSVGGFQGTVTAGDDSLPDGTVVTAWIDDVQVAQAKTSSSTYSLFITGYYTGKTVI